MAYPSLRKPDRAARTVCLCQPSASHSFGAFAPCRALNSPISLAFFVAAGLPRGDFWLPSGASGLARRSAISRANFCGVGLSTHSQPRSIQRLVLSRTRAFRAGEVQKSTVSFLRQYRSAVAGSPVRNCDNRQSGGLKRMVAGRPCPNQCPDAKSKDGSKRTMVTFAANGNFEPKVIVIELLVDRFEM
jgi:hypothetical protein